VSLFNKHEALVLKAIDALHERTFFAAFPENPSPANYGENADSDGREKFQSSLGKKFDELKQTNPGVGLAKKNHRIHKTHWVFCTLHSP